MDIDKIIDDLVTISEIDMKKDICEVRKLQKREKQDKDKQSFNMLKEKYKGLKTKYNASYDENYELNDATREETAENFQQIFKKQLKEISKTPKGERFLRQIHDTKGDATLNRTPLKIVLTNDGGSGYNESSNKITYDLSDVIHSKNTKSGESQYFTIKPLITERSKIEGEDVVKVEDGLSPFHFTIAH